LRGGMFGSGSQAICGSTSCSSNDPYNVSAWHVVRTFGRIVFLPGRSTPPRLIQRRRRQAVHSLTLRPKSAARGRCLAQRSQRCPAARRGDAIKTWPC
jgi:hypothetical protein